MMNEQEMIRFYLDMNIDEIYASDLNDEVKGAALYALAQHYKNGTGNAESGPDENEYMIHLEAAVENGCITAARELAELKAQKTSQQEEQIQRIRDKYADMRFNQLNSLIGKGDLNACLVMYERSLEDDPEQANAFLYDECYRIISSVTAEKDNETEALAALWALIANNTENEDIKWDALRKLSEILRKDSDNLNRSEYWVEFKKSMNMLADYYKEQGEPQKEKECYLVVRDGESLQKLLWEEYQQDICIKIRREKIVALENLLDRINSNQYAQLIPDDSLLKRLLVLQTDYFERAVPFTLETRGNELISVMKQSLDTPYCVDVFSFAVELMSEHEKFIDKAQSAELLNYSAELILLLQPFKKCTNGKETDLYDRLNAIAFTYAEKVYENNNDSEAITDALQELADRFTTEVLDQNPDLRILLIRGLNHNFGFSVSDTELKAHAGDSESQYMMGRRYLKEKDIKTGYKWLRQAADSGHEKAVCNLASLVYNDQIVSTGQKKLSLNASEVFDWNCKAAKLDFSDSFFNLAYLYHNGIGTTKNDDESEKWYRAFINKYPNSGSANHNLALLLWEKREKQEAITRFAIALEQKNSFAPGNIAGKLASLRTVNEYTDQERVYQALQKYPDTKNNDVQYALAVCYIKGFGTPADKEKAYQIFSELEADGYQWKITPFELYIHDLTDEKKAEAAIKNLEECNDFESFSAIGRYYSDKEDPDKAFDWLKKAANIKEDKDIISILDTIAIKHGEKLDPEERFNWLKRAAEKEQLADSYYLLAQLYEQGKGTKKDPVEAIRWYERFVKARPDANDANLSLAGLLWDKGEKQAAIERYTAGINNAGKDSKAQSLLADYIAAMTDVSGITGQEQVFRAYTNCPLENQSAKYGLAVCYFKGFGVATDYAKAISILDELAENGYFNQNSEQFRKLLDSWEQELTEKMQEAGFGKRGPYKKILNAIQNLKDKLCNGNNSTKGLKVPVMQDSVSGKKNSAQPITASDKSKPTKSGRTATVNNDEFLQEGTHEKHFSFKAEQPGEIDIVNRFLDTYRFSDVKVTKIDGCSITKKESDNIGKPTKITYDWYPKEVHLSCTVEKEKPSLKYQIKVYTGPNNGERLSKEQEKVYEERFLQEYPNAVRRWEEFSTYSNYTKIVYIVLYNV